MERRCFVIVKRRSYRGNLCLYLDASYFSWSAQDDLDFEMEVGEEVRECLQLKQDAEISVHIRGE